MADMGVVGFAVAAQNQAAAESWAAHAKSLQSSLDKMDYRMAIWQGAYNAVFSTLKEVYGGRVPDNVYQELRDKFRIEARTRNLPNVENLVEQVYPSR